MTTKKSALQIKVGDRVKLLGQERYSEGTVCDITSLGEMTVWVDSQCCEFECIDPQDTELVEVAHYAPPGVTMVALTPERIEALRTIISATFGGGDGPMARTLRSMLAEANGKGHK